MACDIDGTLVENGYINPKNVEKIEYFMSEGGIFSIATGRSVTAISVVTDTLKRISPSVVANGCMIYDYQNQKILYHQIAKRICFSPPNYHPLFIILLYFCFFLNIQEYTQEKRLYQRW